MGFRKTQLSNNIVLNADKSYPPTHLHESSDFPGQYEA